MSELTEKLISTIVVFFLSMTPVIEVRGAIPYGVAAGLPFWVTFLFSIAGNMILTPFIILFVRKIFYFLRKIKFLRSAADWCENRVMKKRDVITKYKILGLTILVAVPLPGTGAWTGAMLAGFLNMRLRDSILSIFAGVIIAAIIVTGVSYGFFGAVDFLGLHAGI